MPPRSPRHARPAFDVVRDVYEEDIRTGWVYRSDITPAAVPPPLPPPRSSRGWTAVPALSRTEPAAPPPPVEDRSSRGWFESTLYVLTLPVAITAAMMFAPVAWVIAARRR